jgi:hemerythrin
MVSVTLMTFLGDWVRSHIQKSDKQYGAWVTEKAKV